MSNIFVDETHMNDGTGDGWADQVGSGGARNDLAAAVNSASAGDFVYVRRLSASQTTAKTMTAAATSERDNPIRVIGVKAATTSTSPTTSDLVPGLRTGSATRAYDQVGADAAPRMVSTANIGAQGYIYFYGLRFATSGLSLNFGVSNNTGIVLEEVELEQTDANDLLFGTFDDSVDATLRLVNSKLNFSGGSAAARVELLMADLGLEGVEFAFTGAKPATLFVPGASGVQGRLTLSGCDLSAYDGTLFDVTNMHSNYPVVLRNCSLNSSATLRSGTANERYRIELYQTEADGAALGAGQSRRQFLVDAWNGTIENDLTFTRAGGASDGASGAFSRKMTPVDLKTQRNFLALEGPEEHVWLEGDGTAKTLTVFVSNSNGVQEWSDDEVWVEVSYPSESGGARHTRRTTQPHLLATPSLLTDDAASDWNGGGPGSNAAQRIDAAIAPDYEGPVYWRLFLARAFGAPASLYYDPRAVVA